MDQGQSRLAYAAREEVFAKLSERVLGLATYLGCKDQAADVAQGVMLVLVARYARVTNFEELVKLANRICVYVVLNRRRGRPVMAQVDDLQLPSAAPDPENVFRSIELREKILEEIERSGERCQKLLLLQLKEASTRQICAELKLKAAAVYTLKFRCAKWLKAALGDLK